MDVLRFISRLFKIDYDTCKSCETLKEQIAIINQEKQMLLNTVISVVKPQVIIEQETKVGNPRPIIPAAMTFSRRRAMLEEQDRVAAQIKGSSPRRGEPDTVKESIEALEEELDVKNA